MENNGWYCIEATLAHQGAGKHYPIYIYVLTKNPIEAFDKYKYMRGIKKRDVVPIKPLNEEKSKKLEQRLLEEGLSLEEAKKRGYRTINKI